MDPVFLVVCRNNDRTGNEPMTFYSDTKGEKLGQICLDYKKFNGQLIQSGPKEFFLVQYHI